VLIALALLSLLLWTPDIDRATLEHQYLQSPADMVEVAGTRLHVRDSGPRDAPAVVLLHGFGASLHTWEAWVPGLAEHHRVIRFDLPGSGLSAPDPTGDYTDERSLEVLRELLDRLGLARASLVGHSMGGRIAWRFAARFADRVERLVLVAPDGFASPQFEYGKKAEVPAVMRLMRHALPLPVLRMSLAPAYAEAGMPSYEVAKRYQDLIRAPGARDAMISRMEQTVLADPVPELQRIQAPTLLLWGERDAIIPWRNAADFVHAMPAATLVTLPGAGHLPQEEAPEASLVAVESFLR
jgi:pimeloyl-ACP methyl ester carboxylesterase